MRAKSFVKTLVNVTETRIDEGAWKKIVTQSVHLEEHCTKIETTFHLFFAPLFLVNLVFKFNTVLIGIFFFFLIMSATIYFFAFWLTFDISLVLKFIQYLYAFYKEKQNFDEARCSIFEAFQLQNALILFFHEIWLLSNGENYSWC